MPKDGITGACPPMIVHTDQSASTETNMEQEPKESDNFYLSPRFIFDLTDPSVGAKDFCEHQNPCDFAGQGTKNGSMTQEIFFIIASISLTTYLQVLGKEVHR